MWPSLTLHAAKGDHGPMLLSADQLLFADNGASSGTAAAANDVADPADPADAGGSANPRKRKKSSRACDFCHLNHQPCDNSKPRCSYCIKHGKKACLYLRPQKKRGPAQGYRSALHTMRESAAAWGVATTLIPDLAPLIASYLEKAEGRRLVKAIKDPQQQDHFIQAWQQSAVFKLFFSDDGDTRDAGDGTYGDGTGDGGDGGDERSSDAADDRRRGRRRMSSGADAQEADADDDNNHDGNPSAAEAAPPPPPPPMSAAAAAAAAAARPRPKFQRLARPLPRPLPPRHQPPVMHPPAMHPSAMHPPAMHPPATHDNHGHTTHTSQDYTTGGSSSSSGPSDGTASSLLADIMARDVAKSSNSFTNTLGLLGFAADETANDFQAMSYHDPAAEHGTADDDALLGSEMDQKAYYELLMGRGF